MKRFLLVFILFLFTATLNADTFVLKNGNKVRGEVITETDTSIMLNVGFGLTQYLSKSDIASRVNESREDTLLYIGKKENQRKQHKRAIKTLERALKLKPGDAKIKKALTDAWLGNSVRENERKFPQAAYQSILNAQKILPQDDDVKIYLEVIKKVITKIDTLEKEGRKLFIQGKHGEAVNLFDQLLKKDYSRLSKIRTPLSESLITLGDDQLKNQKFTNASEYYDRSLTINPDLILSIEDRWASAHLNPAASDIENRNYQSALLRIQKVLLSAPNNDNALYLLGITLRNLQRNKDAREVFETILKNHKQEITKDISITELTKQAEKHFKKTITLVSLNEAKAQIQKSLEGDWKIVQGKNWKLYHHSEYFADQITLVMDDLLKRVTKEFSGSETVPEIKPGFEVYLYRNFEEYKEKTKAVGWSAGVTRTKEVGGSIVSRHILTYQAATTMSATMPHELGHIILPILMKRNPSKIPHWFNEGMCVRLEPPFKTDYYRNLIQQEKASGKKLALSTILSSHDYPGDEETVKMYYAKCYVFVDYLMKDMGKKNLLEWAKTLDHNNSLKIVKQKYKNIEKLEATVFGN